MTILPSYADCAWLPLLIEYVVQTTGPILTINAGAMTARCLATLCARHERLLATVGETESFGRWHVVGSEIPQLDKWGIVLVDPKNPVEYLHRFANADVVLVPNCGECLVAVKQFTYQRQYGWLQPPTAAASNSFNVRKGG